MEVEEISDKEEEKQISEIAPPPAPTVPPEKMEEENRSVHKEIQEDVHEAPSSLEEPAMQQEKEHIVPSVPDEAAKKDIVSELFRTNETTVQYPDVTVRKKSGKVSVIIWIILLFVIVACIGGGLLFFKNQQASSTGTSPEGGEVTTTLSPSATPIETPTPTESASASASQKKEITVQVWNGSGKSGAASLMKELLEEKGYTVKSTGNAPSFSKDETAIYVKSSNKEYLELLKKDIGEKYSLGTTAATLDESVAFDARVIVGEE